MPQAELITEEALQATFSERLRALRKERGETQREAAERFDIHRPNWAQYENGKILPRFETLLQIADVWEVPVDWLLMPEGRRDLDARPDDELLAWFVRIDEGLTRLAAELPSIPGREPPWTQKEHFGSRLRRARLSRGMTQGDVAEALGAKRVQVSQYEVSGRVPRLPRLAQLSQLLGTSVEALVRDEPKWPELHLAAPEAELYRHARGTSNDCRQMTAKLLERIGTRLWQRVASGPPVAAPGFPMDDAFPVH